MLGTVLREARLAAELTQEEVAFRAGLDRSYVSMLENDKKSPTVDVLLRLAEAIGTKASGMIAQVERQLGQTRRGR
jgi:transcriptional regulator with XRE-family HTH domain